MRICPYVSFKGNCAEAVAFYEKVFKAKAEIMRYKDAPPDNGYGFTAKNENYVMHAQFEVGGEIIMFCDTPPENPIEVGDNIVIMVEFDDADTAKGAFDILKEGGEVYMELQETFWSKCFGSLTDKFGINWNISVGCG